MEIIKPALQLIGGQYFKPCLATLGHSDIPIFYGPTMNPDKTPCVVINWNSGKPLQADITATQMTKTMAHAVQSYEFNSEVAAFHETDQMMAAELIFGFAMLLRTHKPQNARIQAFDSFTQEDFAYKEGKVLYGAAANFLWTGLLELEIPQPGFCFSGDDPDSIADASSTINIHRQNDDKTITRRPGEGTNRNKL